MIMTQHFSELSTSYNELRTTDEEPIDYVKDYLSDTECIKGLDIGCGSGSIRSSDVAKNTGSLSKFVLTLTRPWLMRRKIISNSMRKVGI